MVYCQEPLGYRMRIFCQCWLGYHEQHYISTNFQRCLQTGM